MDYYALLGILDQLLKLGLVLLLPFIPGDALYIYGWLMFSIGVINFILNIVYAKIKFVEIIIRESKRLNALMHMGVKF